jgi:rod shape-determining protein MreC
MTLRRRLLDYGLALVLLAVPAVMLRANLKDSSDLNGFDRAVLHVSSPLQAGVSWIVGGVGSVWNRYVWLVDVEAENRELRDENERLARELSALRQQAADVPELVELARLRRRTAAESVGARVVAASVNPHFRIVRLRIDRGEGEVAPGMPIVVRDGLVGRVQRVYGSYADVLLVTDPRSSVDVVIARTGGRGVLTGLSSDRAYRAEIEYLERDRKVEVGDRVVTSGLGGAFPAGIEVGTIVEIKTREYGLYQEVEVEPAVDFASLRSALVLLAPPPAPDPDAGADKSAPAAHGVRAF